MNNLYQNIQGQQFNPATISSIPYKPITFEKLSNVIGMTYNLSAIENMNTISLPRGGEQQIFFVNNDDRIYTRAFDNSIGIIAYKQDYVERLQKELNEAQSQLHEIFESVAQNEQSNETSPFEERLLKVEQRLKMFDEDHAIILREIGKKEKEGYFAKEGKWDYLYDYYMEQKCDLANKVKNFK